MLWVICGHTYIFTFMTPVHNMSDVIQWTSSFSSTWISACPIVVDTFFTLSGILCIFVISDNITAKPFLKHIHIFYLYRILRVFPILATMVLLQSSILTWISDGPEWEKMGMATEYCRQRWWSTLLHIQNYYRPLGICIFQSWYITVDTQLYMLSPFVIVFLLGSSLVAWIALTAVGLASMTIVAVYVAKYEFPSALVNVFYTDSFVNFFHDFYFNTATRASPFVIGIFFGYLLKKYRRKKIKISMKYVIVFWITAFASMAYCVFGIYETVSIPYEFTLFDAILNSTMKALWATSLCWLILACAHDYGGPINWFLSLPLWKLPARLSYAVYLVHVQILLVLKSSVMKLPYFTDLDVMYEIAGITLLSLLLSFFMCVLIDAPASTLVKLLLMQKRPIENQQKSAAIEEDFSSENKCRHFH
ncbi:O-acyltransferase like protein-like [Colias croceus]|uniref:O-acyltransferase like protein-like n=1 Tax=Colias crocea TaxID=72248 RepID=UPI001E27E59F|nr:O-acyltransferase like protein-like [Colias croceus]